MRFAATLLYCLSFGAAVTFALPTLVSRSYDLTERDAALDLEGVFDEVSSRAPMELSLDMEFQERQLDDSFLYPRAPLPKKTKTAIEEALNVMAGETVAWTWQANWNKGHGARTSKLNGFKPGSRRDSKGGRLYWVGIFTVSNKDIGGPAWVQASFATEPSTTDAVTALRAALQKA
ncbi:hypothetical protein EST38_g8125 [Candolleomyces aberdarensis]|uniref:Uncharacterized protein n=1 Tax=Candolleomyces aberdarensis TaxID=2316362 RepID=A0A4Q2DDC6_9AGAR|nr:hypothetical protein EST38_g8125 [Candolleomyces aberdarensis]